MRGKVSKAARVRRQRQALRAELERVSEFVERETRLALALLDEPAMCAEPAVALEGRVEGEAIVVDKGGVS